MSLPHDFQFSQSSLQDFEVCPRRFELRYLWQLRWPAVEAEPIQEAERLRRLGIDFHRLIQQHLVGLDQAKLTETLRDENGVLKSWWHHYLAYRPPELAQALLYPELGLSIPLADYRLTARFDLLAIQPDGTFLIVDWKTTQREPSRDWLARRVQTRVYPYVLAAAGAAYNQGQPIAPEAIKMMYWYPEFPNQPEMFAYGATQFKQDEQTLSELIAQIKYQVTQRDFPLVEDRKPCKHCVYRSFCDRGIQAGPTLELEVEAEDDLDLAALAWDQIAEIQF